MGNESEVFLNKHAINASLLFQVKTVPYQSRRNDEMRAVVCCEFL